MTFVEYLANFAGLASGFALSPRNIAFGVIALVIGVFRLSAAWALLLAGVAGLSHVHLLSNAGRYDGFSAEYELYSQSMTLAAAFLVLSIWFVLGRSIRFFKAPMLSEKSTASIQAQSGVPKVYEELMPGTVEEQSLRPVPSIDAPRSERTVQPLLAVLLGGLFLLVLAGFGIQVYRPLPPETPVLFGYVKQPGQGLVWRYATVDCVRNGDSLEGYVWNRGEMMSPLNIFDLQPEISVGSLGQVRALARKLREYRDADPLCSQADGFSGRGHPLIMSLFD